MHQKEFYETDLFTQLKSIDKTLKSIADNVSESANFELKVTELSGLLNSINQELGDVKASYEALQQKVMTLTEQRDRAIKQSVDLTELIEKTEVRQDDLIDSMDELKNMFGSIKR